MLLNRRFTCSPEVHAHVHCPFSSGVYDCATDKRHGLTFEDLCRIYEEEDIFVAVDARTESLQSLRELGPPDLVYLVKQPKANSTRQVREYVPSIVLRA